MRKKYIYIDTANID